MFGYNKDHFPRKYFSCIGVVIICILISGIGVFIVAKDLQSKKFYDKTIQAEVIQVKTRTDSDGDRKYKPFFTYTYKDKTYNNNYDWSNKRYKVGQIIDIQISSDDPSKIYKSNFWLGIIISLIGIVMLADFGIKYFGREKF